MSQGSNLVASKDYLRDLIGYGRTPPQVTWPQSAKIAVQFVINYEEGGENCILDGDAASEAFLSDVINVAPRVGLRHKSVESLYEYGSRAGFWRLHRLFGAFGVPATVFAVGLAIEKNPDVVDAMLALNWEIASHGYRWIDYQSVTPDVERAHIRRAIEIHNSLIGTEPAGWYIGRDTEWTRQILLEEAKPLYDSDSYADDLPYWVPGAGKPHLIVPYTLDVNDMRFLTAQGFNSGDQFFTYLKDSFDVLYAEGAATPKMLSIGLHCRISGRPGRLMALKRFIEYVLSHSDVWVCRRDEIARHWSDNHPCG
ncbi:MAG: allantoinase [Halothiobacillus sp. 24-54-40]|jgi:putative urate catabolism protein|nr:MAG: allantoinase [Halothiobacillus sp. 20-53-49]OYY32506.1 MAG: allantoinase [Halothiobacillus sp. 35-54-62]OYZ85518.1 MAG: allantoinase [Halothiobacillus sp. 24-54-40]OZA79261.1 MAG: allantoinase [Halothiobacillus sp. 39-53-45]HQS03919.1 allantoinase PuuE [Halothiobacillus sp.]HQT37955.1 allantoinase PuuE [Acidocella sp.]